MPPVPIIGVTMSLHTDVTQMAILSMINARKHAVDSYPYLSIKEVSERYDVSIRTLRRMQAAGLMPPRHKRGRLLEYPTAAIDTMFPKRIA
jgi:hypothetical protein